MRSPRVAFHDIGATIGRRLGLPVEPREPDHFGCLARPAGADMAAASARTRAWLDGTPTEPDLLADLRRRGYLRG